MIQFLGRVAAGFIVLSSAAAVAADFAVESAMLDNGMQVVVVPDHRAPLVTQLLYYRVGSADEGPRNRGIAHMVEHMMFQGTATTPGEEFRNMVARHGGRENAFTSADLTGYWQTVGKQALEVVMRLEADRMRNLTFEEAEFASEIEVVHEERRTRYESGPGGPFGEAMDFAAYQTHPYRYPTIGFDFDIDAFTIEKARAWYDTWYVPNNAILVVAGDTDLAEVMALAEEHYGVIPRGELPPRWRPQEAPQQAERRVILRDSRVRQPSFNRSYMAPVRTDRDGFAPALTVLADILSGSTGTLYQALVVEQGLASSAGAYYGGGARDMARFGIWVAPGQDSDVGAMERAVDEVLAKVLAEGVTEEDVVLAQTLVRANLVYRRDNVTGLARRLGAGLALGLAVEEITTWSEQVDAVTVEDVNAAARHVLRRERSVTGLLLPEVSDAL